MTSPTTWSLLESLPLTIDTVTFDTHELRTSPQWSRTTTELRLLGEGQEGRGEDVNYTAADHAQIPPLLEQLALAGEWTLGGFSEYLDGVDLFATGPVSSPGMEPYRRWALESAALDLALRQAGTTLAAAVGRPAAPVTFCLSMSLGSPPSLDTVHGWITADPHVRFKIDASREFTAKLAGELAATGRVDVVDIKGHYVGDWIDNTPDPALYALLAENFTDAWFEDAMLTPECRAALSANHGLERLTWDAPIHSVDDVTALEDRPAAINIKPSRFGTTRRLLDTIDHCRGEGIPLYGGGQFELGVGRRQIQRVASIWYPDAVNDVAPAVYHSARPGDDVPRSPLVLDELPGF